MRVTNHIEPEELMAYLDGELSSDQARSTAVHLESCEECQKTASDFQKLSVDLMAWEIEPSRGEAPFGTASPVPNRITRIRWWQWSSVAAMVVFFCLIAMSGLFFSNQKMAKRYLPSADLVRREAEPAASMIARTANLTIAVKSLSPARVALEVSVSRHQGYFAQLTTNAPAGSTHSLDAEVRVPSGELDDVINELRQLGRVESETQSAEEVGKAVADLQARIANSRISEQRMQELIRQRTGKLSEVLEAEKEIGRVRGEIEQMEAEYKGLRGRVEYSALTVHLNEEDGQAKDNSSSTLRGAAAAGFRGMIESVKSASIFLLANGPAWVLWGAILFFPARFLWRRVKSNSKG